MTVSLLLVGGGPANALLAYRLKALRPELDMLLLERDETLGGNHLWCFHGSDLTAEQHAWIAPFVERSWSQHDVRFPRRRRTLRGSYHAVTSERLDRVVREALGGAVELGAHVGEVTSDGVRLDDGREIRAAAVVDGRGFTGSAALRLAYQKFLGQVLELGAGHGLDRPLLMDATVRQLDGYRFVYTLPFGPSTLLVEDTRYSDGSHLERDEMREEIRCYASTRGWRVRRVAREEEGVLPIVLGGDPTAFWPVGDAVPRSGMRAGLFHPTTGYSFPESVRLADDACRLPRLNGAELAAWTRERFLRTWKRGGYFRMLNRMLFRAAEPERRYVVFERFYGLSRPLIERFYAGTPTLFDRARILVGRPPVPLGRALGCLRDRPASAERAQPEPQR